MRPLRIAAGGLVPVLAAGCAYGTATPSARQQVLDTVRDARQRTTALAAATADVTETVQSGTDPVAQGKGTATTVNTKIGNAPGSNDVWKYTAGKYVLQNSYMDPASVYNPDTVIAITVKTSIAPYKDPAGNPVPVTHFEGSGKAVIFHGGQVEKVKWSKDGVEGLPTFTAKDGSEVKIPAGHVWISLVPKGGESVSAGSVSWSK